MRPTGNDGSTLEYGKVVGRSQVARSVGVLAVSQGLRIASGFVSLAFVSRLLSPDDVGLVACAAPLLGIAGLVQDLGLSQVLVQKRDLTSEQAASLFWWSACSGLLVSLAVALLAVPMAGFYGRPELVAVVFALSAMPFLGGLQAQHGALLTRRMSFGTVSLCESVNAVAGTAFSLALAWYLRSFWALVLSSVITGFVGLLLAWSCTGWFPALPRSTRSFRGLVRSGGSLSLSSIMNFVARNADTVVIGRWAGPVQLGFYDRAYKMLMFPLQQLNAPVGRVLMPYLASVSDDAPRYRSAYSEAMTFVMLAVHPVMLVAAVFSAEVTATFLGPAWAGVAPIFAWLGFCAVNQVFTGTIGWLMVSQDRHADLIRSSVFGCVVAVLSFFVGVRWGALGVAVSYVVSDYLVRLPVFWYLAARTGPVRLPDVGRIALPHALACLGTLATLHFLKQTSPTGGFPLIVLAGILALGTYVTVLMSFPHKRVTVFGNVGRITRRLRPSFATSS